MNWLGKATRMYFKSQILNGKERVWLPFGAAGVALKFEGAQVSNQQEEHCLCHHLHCSACAIKKEGIRTS